MSSIVAYMQQPVKNHQDHKFQFETVIWFMQCYVQQGTRTGQYKTSLLYKWKK